MNASSSTLDLGTMSIVVLIVYLGVLIAMAVVAARRSRMSEEDFYLAGRGQGMWVTMFTIMATFFSSAAILGIPGNVYRDGVAFVLFALNVPVAGVTVYLIGSRIRRIGKKRGYLTPADMVAEYYGDSSAVRLLVALIGFLYVLPYIVMQIKAGGYLAQTMFPRVGAIQFLGSEYPVFQVGAAALSLVTMLYVLVGGMRSVAWTDVLQGVLLMTGMLVAGAATVFALGGLRGFGERLATLPPEALSVPGVTHAWSPWRLMTICAFSSTASLIQPGQWMRYYAARSTQTLRQSAVIFALVLPVCFLFGIMPVGLGGRVLYPPVTGPEGLQPHASLSGFDQIVPVMIQQAVPQLLGPLGLLLVAVILVAVMAASMSTADSNLHALSAVLTRDVYDRFVRPEASQRERAWVGRVVIVVATLLALWFVRMGEVNPDFQPLRMIASLMFVAIAFAGQLLPATIDILWVRRGTRVGMISGTLTGLFVVVLFTPLPSLLLGAGQAQGIVSLTDHLRTLLDIGFIGFVANSAVFVLVSLCTQPVDPLSRKAFGRDLEGKTR